MGAGSSSHTKTAKFHPKLKEYFNKREVVTLTLIYGDLATRSQNGMLTKEALLRYITLPGLWGERILNLFKKKSAESKYISLEDFLLGMARVCRADSRKRAEVLFDLIDLDEDGYIGRSDFVTMILNYSALIPIMQQAEIASFAEREKEAFSFSPDKTWGNFSTMTHLEAEHFHCRSPSNRSIETKDLSPVRGNKRNYGSFKKGNVIIENFFREWTMTDTHRELAYNLVEQTITGYGGSKTGFLSLDEFEGFLQKCPKFVKEFQGKFRVSTWASPKHSVCRPVKKTANTDSSDDEDFAAIVVGEEEDKKSSKKKRKGFGCISAGVKRSKTKPTHMKRDPNVIIGGYLWQKSGSESKMRWVVIKNQTLFYYKNQESDIPKGAIFLDGCGIEGAERETAGQNYLIKIKHPYADKFYKFFTTEKIEFTAWMQKMKQAARQKEIRCHYEFGKLLGSGYYSEVFRGKCKNTNEDVAIKRIRKDIHTDLERDFLRSEIAILRILNHPLIPGFKDIFEDRDYIYLVMELCEGGELFDSIKERKRFPENECRKIIKDLIMVISYLHDLGVVHRDLKPENILLDTSDPTDELKIKLIDFGLASMVAPIDVMHLTCGSLSYIAPEILAQQGYKKEVDAWSIGIITHLLLTGKLPFDSKNEKVTIMRTLAAELDFERDEWQAISEDGKDLVDKLLKKRVDERITIEEAMNHPWFSNISAFPRHNSRDSMDSIPEDQNMLTLARCRSLSDGTNTNSSSEE